MKHRWILVAIALLAASAFAVSVVAGRWWSLGEVEIGPFGGKQCFGGGDCKRIGLTWIGGTERWMRFGTATWAGGLMAMLVLVVVAAGIAVRRVPKLAARTALVALGTAILAGTMFVVQYPGIDGAGPDRGLVLFAVGAVLGLGVAITVLRAPPAPDVASA